MQHRLNEVAVQYANLIYLNLVLPDQWPIADQTIATVVVHTVQHQVLPSQQFQHIQVMEVQQLMPLVCLYNQPLLVKFPKQ